MGTYYVSIKRIGQLMKNELVNHKQIIIMIAILFIVINLMTSIDQLFDGNTYLFFLYVGGFILSSAAFSELHNPLTAYQALMLPCSYFERFLSKWLLTAVVYAIGLFVLYYLCLLLKIRLIIIPIDPHLLTSTGKYILLQSAFLLGAISFKKHTLIKTAITVGLTMMVLTDLYRASNVLFLLILAIVCWTVTYLKLTEYELK